MYLWTVDSQAKFDLTMVGNIKFASGLERIPITFISILKDTFKINYIPTYYCDKKDIQQDIVAIIENPHKKPGTVSILTDPIWSYPHFHYHAKVPDSFIKIAYSMIESTAIPKIWSDVLNEKFDAVVVPDEFLVEVYKACGVNIPIFVVPLPIDLKEFLTAKKKKKTKNAPFYFGTSATCVPGKNIELLIRSFHYCFDKTNEDVRLKIHTRGGTRVAEIQKLLKKFNDPRISFIHKSLSKREYIQFMKSLDCYVQISTGEGYSVTTREAMALEIPCIVSNSTAQKTICKSGCVRTVPANIPFKAFYDFHNQYLGYKFTPLKKDVRRALKDVYQNYNEYQKKALKGKKWVKQFDLRHQPLIMKLKNLVKPSTVIFGNKNKITQDALITNSVALYEKYQKIAA